MDRSIYLYIKLQHMKIESTLASIAPFVFQAQDANSAKEILIKHLCETNVKDRDKMIQDIQQLTSLQDIHRYTANSLLKYEGLSPRP